MRNKNVAEEKSKETKIKENQKTSEIILHIHIFIYIVILDTFAFIYLCFFIILEIPVTRMNKEEQTEFHISHMSGSDAKSWASTCYLP